jgi:ankyrin repeat protein
MEAGMGRSINFTTILVIMVLVALFSSCGKSPEEARRELRQMNVEYSENSFIKSAKEGDILAIRLFLNAGMNPNAKDGEGKTALIAASEAGRDQVVKLLLAKGADIEAKDNERDATALLWASAKEKTKTMRILLDKGANIRAKDKDGDNALIRAA